MIIAKLDRIVYTIIMEKKNPQQRIIEAASWLFYRNGFAETGINEILEESSSHKASLYRYFESKNELGLATLELEKKRFLSFLTRALKKYTIYADFVRFWVKTIKRTMTGYFKRGCPFVRYSQTSGSEAFFNRIINQVFSEAEILLQNYFITNKYFNTSEAGISAKKALAVYEGSVQMVILTSDPAYFTVMESLLLSVI